MKGMKLQRQTVPCYGVYGGAGLTCVPVVHTVWRVRLPVYHSVSFAVHLWNLLQLPSYRDIVNFSECTTAVSYALSSYLLVETLQVQPGYLDVVQQNTQLSKACVLAVVVIVCSFSPLQYLFPLYLVTPFQFVSHNGR